MLRLIDLLAVAIDDMRQGGDPRLPLELALVKVTRPHADLSRESLAHRVELLEARPMPGPPARRRGEPPPSPLPRRARHRRASRRTRPAGRRRRARAGPAAARARQLQDAWQRGVLDVRAVAVDPDRDAARRSAPGRARRRHAHDRVPARGRLPPRAGRGPEEHRAAARRALRGDRPQARIATAIGAPVPAPRARSTTSRCPRRT